MKVKMAHYDEFAEEEPDEVSDILPAKPAEMVASLFDRVARMTEGELENLIQSADRILAGGRDMKDSQHAEILCAYLERMSPASLTALMEAQLSSATAYLNTGIAGQAKAQENAEKVTAEIVGNMLDADLSSIERMIVGFLRGDDC